MKLLTIGTDPEMFLTKDGEIVSAIGLIGGSKKQPKPLATAGYYVQEDNVLVEFNTPPVETRDQFVHSVVHGVSLVEETLSHGYGLEIKTSHYMPPSEVSNRKAKMFGCDPDFNAWTMEPQLASAPANGLRTCGGHVYVGYENPTLELSVKLAKSLDIILGLPSIFLDDDEIRRSLYGKAGSFRPKSFGMEYRTLSSFWIKDLNHIRYVYDGVQKALSFVGSGNIDLVSEIDGLYIQAAINGTDKELAQDLMDKFKVKLPK